MSGWLTAEQLSCDCDRFHGVRVSFLGEDCDGGVAITDCWRRGAAAIHAMCRTENGVPAKAGSVEVVWARFYPLAEEYQDSDVGNWVMQLCHEGDDGAMRVVWAKNLNSYVPVPFGGDTR